MELDKKYRHTSNPKEQELHDKFVEHCRMDDYSYIAFPTINGVTPLKFVTEQEKQIMINTIQWLGSPVGRNFLRDCGYEYAGDKPNISL